MKTCKGRLLVKNATLICGLLLARGISAQTFTTLHNFTGGGEGAEPFAGLTLSGNILYGTTYEGTSGNTSWVAGTIFSINPDGSGFTNLHTFAAITNNDSANGTGPMGPLIVANDIMYGTTGLGGSSSNGTVFSVRTDGTGFRLLYSFTAVDNISPANSDGSGPRSELILSGDTLFGTAEGGGGLGDGTIFSVKTNGSAFTVLHAFNNVDGSGPIGGLILSDHTLYGTAASGGPWGRGTIFSINTDGTGFTNLYSFMGGQDGGSPCSRLNLSSGILYGTALDGGSSYSGTVFSVRTDGTGFTVLHSFTSNFTGGITTTNMDGAWPFAGLVLCGDTLYGTARAGGTSRNGTVFCLKTNGSDFRVLHSFTARETQGTNSDGAVPNAVLILSGNTLYGTALAGGSSDYGTAFSISLPVRQPQLTIAPAAGNVILTWPTNFTGYTLQSTTNLASRLWTTNSPVPVVVNGQFTATNPISGTQQFFRLSQ